MDSSHGAYRCKSQRARKAACREATQQHDKPTAPHTLSNKQWTTFGVTPRPKGLDEPGGACASHLGMRIQWQGLECFCCVQTTILSPSSASEPLPPRVPCLHTSACVCVSVQAWTQHAGWVCPFPSMRRCSQPRQTLMSWRTCSTHTRTRRWVSASLLTPPGCALPSWGCCDAATCCHALWCCMQHKACIFTSILTICHGQNGVVTCCS